MRPTRRGFSTLELLIVVVLLGILASLTAPRLSTVTNSVEVSAARQQIAATLTSARTAAIHRGRPVAFIRSGNTIGVFMDSAGSMVNLGGVRDLGTLHGVTLQATRNVIRYNARGMAVGLVASETIVVSRDGASDSVCVLRLGKVSRKDCAS